MSKFELSNRIKFPVGFTARFDAELASEVVLKTEEFLPHKADILEFLDTEIDYHNNFHRSMLDNLGEHFSRSSLAESARMEEITSVMVHKSKMLQDHFRSDNPPAEFSVHPTALERMFSHLQAREAQRHPAPDIGVIKLS